MSSYPPPPPFGGVYGGVFNNQAPLMQSATSLPGLPHFSYPSSHTTASHTGSVANAQHYNAYSFDTNKQETLTTFQTNRNAGTLPSGFDQRPNKANPNGPAASTSVPPKIQTQLAPQRSVANPVPYTHDYDLQKSRALGFDSASQAETNLAPNSLATTAAPATSDLEDGELSEEDISKKNKAPSLMDTSFNGVTMGSPRFDLDGQMPHTRNVPTKDQYQPHHSDKMRNGTSVDHDKREQAKAALRTCNTQGLTFIHFVREGVDSELLQGLYTEIGIELSSQELAAVQVLQKEHAARYQFNRTNQSATSTGEQSALSTNHVSLTTQQPTSTGVADVVSQIALSARGVEASDAAPKDNQSPKPGISEISDRILSNATPSNTPTQNSTKAGEKSYDRKDHIARLLAAKAGKSALKVNDSASTRPAKVSEPNSLQDSVLKASPLASSIQGKKPEVNTFRSKPDSGTDAGRTEETRQSPSTSAMTTRGMEETPSHPSQITPAVTGLEAKKRAQTELARRKMEALLNRNSIQSPEVPVSQSVLPQAPKENDSSPTVTNKSTSRPSPAISIPAAPHVPPTPRSSFFSPTPGRQFSLPGLFMPAAPPTPSETHENEGSKTISDQPVLSTPISQHLSRQPNIEDTLPLPGSQRTPQSPIDEPKARKSSSTEIVNKTRKRQKAADFIDPPSTRIKRLFGQSGDKSVVIEVSEDEAPDGSMDDVDMDVDVDQGTYSLGQIEHDTLRHPQRPIAPDSQLQRSISTLTRTQVSTGTMSPLVPQTIAKDSGGLKSKEMEIEMMKRKIAEVEQRRKARQAGSRAQTPNASKAPSTPKQSRASSEVIALPKASLSPSNSTIVATDQNEDAAEATRTSAREKEMSSQERLLAEQLAVNTHQEPASESEPHLPPGLEQRRHEEEQDQIGLEEGRAQEVLEQHDADVDGNLEVDKRLLRDLEAQRAMQIEKIRSIDLEEQRLNESLQQPSRVGSPVSAEITQISLVAEGTVEQEKIRRRAAIEAGLPLLDAEVQKTERKLQYLRDQVQELESELQRGIEGRRNLMEELQVLSQYPEVTPEAPNHTEDAVNDIRFNGTDNQGSPYSPNFARDTSAMADIEANNFTPATASLPVSAVLRKPSLPGLSPALASNDDLEEDIMDISRSDVDEGEISNQTLQPTNPTRSGSQSVDGEDAYEPPTTIDVNQTAPLLPSNIQSNQGGLGGHDMGLTFTPLLHTGVMTASTNQTTSQPIGPSSTAHLSTQAQDPDIGPQANYGSGTDDPDDSQPPEPVSSSEFTASEKGKYVDDTQLHRIASVSADDQPSAPVIAPGVQMTAGAVDLQTEPLSERKHNHFAPYESPLKQFKSYRHHRSYSTDVANGFRSLTYSHNIDSEKPICPFEIGGICNDPSCPHQHFRNMSLSDNMILVQLGNTPEGLSHEQQTAYTEGLKSLIRDIRSRNVRDFNAMAADITSYRANFIGDTTKILPL